MPLSAEEQVLVVERQAFFGGDWPQGFVRLGDAEEGSALLLRLEEVSRFVPRSPAETNPSLKQLIPYCAVRSADKVFCVQRLKAQGEARLHGKLSIGIGGHINPVDTARTSSQDLVLQALTRELHEELVLPQSIDVARARLVGLINDDATEVGSVHLGLAFVLEIDAAEQAHVRVREISKMRGSFRRLVGSDGVWQDPPLLESWSRFMVGEFAVGKADSGPRTHLEGDG